MSKSDEIIYLVLADDHATTRAGIRAILEGTPDIQVMGEAKDGYEAQQLTARLRPHILLLDLQMPGPRPAEVERWVRMNCPETITLVLTAHDRDAYLATMVEAGVAGFLAKHESAENLVAAIRCAARGEILFNDDQRARAHRWNAEVGTRWSSLTERERQVLMLMAVGKKDSEIARELHITVKTVGNHVSSVLSKLKAASRTEAALWAVNEGFIKRDGSG